MKRNPWISTALLAVVAVAGTAEAKTNAQLAAAPGVSTTKEGADPAALLSADAAKAPVESRLQWAAACGDVPAGQSQSYSAVLDVDATGAVTAVTRGVSTVAVEVGTCLDGVFKEVRFPALSAADASVKVTVSVSLVGEAEAPAAAAPAPAAPAPAAVPAPAVTTAAPAAAVNTTEAKAKTDDSKTSDSKPWSVTAGVGMSFGSGLFVNTGDDPTNLNAGLDIALPDGESDGAARYLAYSLSFGASYKLNDLLRASLGISMDQELTATNQTDGARARTFYFRETSLGLATSGLWKDEEYTGIGVDVSGRVFLPTDVASAAAGRIMALGAGLSVKRSFADIGPGTISVSYGLSVRGNFGGAQKYTNPSRRYRQVTEASQVTGFQLGRNDPVAGLTSEGIGGLNTMSSLSNRFGVSYAFLDDWTVAIEYGINNAFQRDGTDGTVDAPLSIHSEAGGGQTDSFSSQISLGYQLNDYVGFSTGIATAGDPFIHNEGESGYSLRFPFFNFGETESNLSTFFLNVDFSY